mgnify:CR=1 FL=1|tara:strand:+ start:37899 stop:38477 length:579 start_codon:yes stop_codon:yes gene_type:complete
MRSIHICAVILAFVFVTLTHFTFAIVSSAQEVSSDEVRPASPKTMFAYLATGMHVGVKSVDGTASVLLFVYTDEDYETALATSKLAGRGAVARDAAAINPAIQRELDAFMVRHNLTEEAAERLFVISPFRTTFGTLGAIGDDYLMIEIDNDIRVDANSTSKRRRIIPKSSIGSINLDAKPVQIVDTRPPSRN